MWLALACGWPESHGPARPPLVGADAVQVDGPDGGGWIRCAPTPVVHRFACTVVTDTGAVESVGEYVRRRLVRGPERAVWVEVGRETRATELRFRLYDGERIELTDDQALFPDGWVDYALAHRCVRYTVGEPLDDRPYATPAQRCIPPDRAPEAGPAPSSPAPAP
jgi:hypothetical protein